MSDICEIRKIRGVHSLTLSLIQVPPKRPGVSRRQLPGPGPVLGAHAEPGAAADLMEVIIQAARLLADYELLAHSLQVLPFQPPPTVSHASSSRRKSWDHPKPNPIPRQRQRSGLCTFPQIPSTKTREVTLRGGKKRRSRAKYPRPPPADRCRGSADRRSPSGRLSEGELRVRARTNIFKGAATFITLLVLLVYAPVSSAQETEAQAPPGAPKLDAGSWTLIDANTGLYLAGKDPDKRVSIASTTKIMLALVAFDEGVNLDDQVTVSEDAASYAGSVYSNVGLYPYDRVSVRDLLTAALVPSGTDADYALAENLGGGSVDEFVGKMNDKAKELGLKNTHFENPAGLDARGHYSSARDLATMTRAAMEYPVFADIVDMEEATIKTQSREIEVFNTNNLLYTYPEATGVKTGTSPEAGPSLVASAEEGGESYIAVVLDARNEQYRFEAAQVALGYGFDNFERRPLVREGKVYEEAPLPYRREESVGLAAAKEVAGPKGPGLKVERRITEKELPLAARAGQEFGTIEVLVDG